MFAGWKVAAGFSVTMGVSVLEWEHCEVPRWLRSVDFCCKILLKCDAFPKKPQTTSLCISERDSRSDFCQSKWLVRCLSKKGPEKVIFPWDVQELFLGRDSSILLISIQPGKSHSRCLMESLKPDYIPFRRQQCQVFFRFLFVCFLFKLIFYRVFQTNSVLCRAKAAGFCQILVLRETFKKWVGDRAIQKLTHWECQTFSCAFRWSVTDM